MPPRNRLLPTATRIALAGLLGLAAAPAALALAPDRAITQYVLESWTVKDGAPAGTITGIAQTPDGYLWLATEGDGLLRFDGVSFAHEDGLDALFGQRIGSVTSLLRSRDGALWVGTTHGLARLRDGRWKAFDGGDARVVFGLHEADDGSIWYARHWEGLFQVVGETVTPRPLAGGPRFVGSDGGGTLWVGGYEGLWRIAGEQRTLFTTRRGLPDDNVNQVYSDRGGDVWICLPVGLLPVRGDRFGRLLTARDGLSNDDVTTVARDRDGSLWVGTANGGLNRQRGAGFEVLTKRLGLTNDHITAIFEDREGSLWVGTAAGLNRLRNASLLPIGGTEGLSPRQPQGIAEGPDGSVYVSSGFDGLSRIRDGRITVSRPQAVPGVRWDGALHVDPDGAVWSAHRDGLSYRGPGGNRAYPAPGIVTCITRDAQGIVFASRNGTIYRFEHGRAARYRLGDGSLLGPESLGFDFVWMLRTARDGTLWLATSRGAIAVRDGVARRVWQQGTLSARSVFEDEEGTVWLGTMAGLLRVRDGSAFLFSARHGLIEEDVHHALVDRRGGVWMSGARGIFRASRHELDQVARGQAARLTLEAFGVAEGMRTSVASAPAQPAGCAARDGRLWFLTAAGIVVVDPEHIGHNDLPPPVVIEQLLVDGRSLGSGPQLVVQPGSDQLAIRYNGLSLLVPGRVRFQYRLEGYDDDWVDAQERRTAFYTKLPPGHYVFRVKAANNDGVWNDRGAAIRLDVLPPFWATWPFRGAVAVMLIGLLALAHRLRVGRIQAHARELAAKVEQRTRELEQVQERLIREERLAVLGKLTATVSHELRNPLTTIRGSLFVVAGALRDGPARARHALERAERNVRRCDGIVDELLEYARNRPPERVRVDVDAWLEGVLGDVAIPPSIAVRRSLESGAWATVDERRLSRCVLNLVTNAADAIRGETPEAAARGSRIEVSSRLCGERVEISVRDDGPGIPPEVRAGLFEPFFSTKTFGVGLGLALVRQIMVEHEGGVDVASRPGETVFTLWFPARTPDDQPLAPPLPAG